MKKLTFTLGLFALAAGIAAAADANAGHAAYDKSCKRCHGADGQPVEMIAKMMKVEMAPLGSAKAQALSDADIKKIILEGKGKMKATAGMTPAQADDVVAFVRTLKK